MKQTDTKIEALAELQKRRQWVVYCLEPDKNNPDRLTKVPYNARNGYKASSTNPKHWSTYEQAVSAYKNAKNADGKPFDGIGFVFNRDMTGIDCDHCRDENGNIDPWAQKVIDEANSYAELSPGQEGIHVLVFGLVPLNEKGKHAGSKKGLPGMRHPKAAIEMYSEGRFFTITGNHLPGTPETIEERQEQLLALHARFNPPKQQKVTQAQSPKPLSHTDNELLDIAMNAKNGRKFTALWQGDTSGYASQSEADQALCNMLAFYTGKDAIRIDSMFRRSGLYREEKWDRNARSGEAYGEGTIRNAIEQCSDVYTQGGYAELVPNLAHNGENGNGHSSKHNGNEHQPHEKIDLCSFDADDAGNSDAMNALYGQNFLWCPSVGWFQYAGTHWRLDIDGAQVKRYAIETLRSRRHAAVDAEKEAIVKCTKADEKRVNSCVSLFKTHVNVSIDSFDGDPDKLNCKNGVLDLRTGTVELHTYKQRFTYCLPVAYASTDYAYWLDYINGVVGGGQEVIDYLQMAVGYSLTGHTREEILFYLFGPSRSGKGSFAEALMALLPTPLATMVDFNSFTTKREGDVSNFDLAPLKPSRLIFASESNRSQSLNPAKIKQLTGGDQIRACYKHRDFFSYRPQFKVWMMSNHPVNGDPEDDALWGRVRVIEFPKSFLGMEDKTIKARLKEVDVLQGILYWAVQGAIKWYRLGAKGLTTPASIEKTTQSQRNELDYVQQWIDACCEDDPEGWISNQDVIASYTAWCKEHNIQYIKGMQSLSQSLKTKGYQPGKQRKVNGKNQKGVEGLYIYPTEVTKDGNGNDGND